MAFPPTCLLSKLSYTLLRRCCSTIARAVLWEPGGGSVFAFPGIRQAATGPLLACAAAPVPVDFAAIDSPTYLVAAREDHIVPWTAAFATTHLIGGECRFVLGASGHIAGVINPASRNRRSHWIDGDLGIGPQTWLRTAREVPGSWWTDWSAWLRSHSRGQVTARADLGSSEFPVIEPAPGRYVRMPAEKPVVM